MRDFEGRIAGASVFASETITLTITFQTLGPLLPGVAVMYSYPFQSDIGDAARAGATVSQMPSSIELGTTLSLVATALATTGSGPSGGNAQSYLDFWLVIYETDGVTPVTVLDVAATPEPSTWALSLLPLSLFCAVRLRRRT